MTKADKLTAAKIALFVGSMIFSGVLSALLFTGCITLLPITQDVAPDRGRLVKAIGICSLGAMAVMLLTGIATSIFGAVFRGGMLTVVTVIIMLGLIYYYDRIAQDILRKVLR